MKTIDALLLVMLFSCAAHRVNAQDDISALEAWKPYAEKEFVADYFKGQFNSIGIMVQETKEELMVVHKGDHLKLMEGIDQDKIEYVIPIYLKDVRNMLTYAEDGKIDKQESFLIMKTLFTPMTAKTLQSEVLQKNVPRFINRLENVTHVTLHSPKGEETVSHTLIYINKEWLVVPGLKGTPKRVFHMSVDDSFEYQKKVNQALKKNTKEAWKEFKKWYLSWRKEVSEKV